MQRQARVEGQGLVGAQYLDGPLQQRLECPLRAVRQRLVGSADPLQQAKLPGFKKVSLKTIKIGKQRDKDAVEFVYNAEQGGTSTTFRQIAFVHAGMGFVFTCSSLQPQFGAADSQVFNPVFAHMEFK